MKCNEPREVGNLCLAGVKGYNEMNGRVYDPEGIATTVRANSGGHNELKIVEETDAVIVRKLTPRECWRLMGFDDASFERAEKVNSNSQLYKQAGNSIVVDVLMAIFKEML